MMYVGHIGYMVSTIGFIVGMLLMNNPVKANKGNSLMVFATIIALLSTVYMYYDFSDAFQWKPLVLIILLIILGSLIGSQFTKRFEMTQMPELVSIFNGLGGLSAALIGITGMLSSPIVLSIGEKLILLTTIFLGLITFSGSIIAYFKLQGKFTISIKLNQAYRIFTLLFSVAMILIITTNGEPEISISHLLLIVVFSLLHGIFFANGVGGGDMPVLISALNGLTGIVTMITGIYFGNTILILLGVFVGFTGIVLTVQMSRAMNRKIFQIFFGKQKAVSGESSDYKNITEFTASQIATDLKLCTNVAIVPGYGLAVAQAQQLCNELRNYLIEEGINFKFIIHPVAGRMPGHMNVLLAEANVEYDDILDMEKGNNFLKNADYCIVIGANDVVNTSAEENASSPIYGMPIIQSYLAKKVIVLKRSMKSGYAGIKNPLFERENCHLFLSDAKSGLEKILNELKIE